MSTLSHKSKEKAVYSCLRQKTDHTKVKKISKEIKKHKQSKKMSSLLQQLLLKKFFFDLIYVKLLSSSDNNYKTELRNREGASCTN